jgi:hypothetical protein
MTGTADMEFYGLVPNSIGCGAAVAKRGTRTAAGIGSQGPTVSCFANIHHSEAPIFTSCLK